LIGDVGFRFFRYQGVEQFVIDLEDRPVDRAGTVGLRLIDVRARSNPLERGLAITLLNESGKRTLLPSLRQKWQAGSDHAAHGENEAFHLYLSKPHSDQACYGAQTYPWPRHSGICTDLSRFEAVRSERPRSTYLWDYPLAESASTRGSELLPSCRAPP